VIQVCSGCGTRWNVRDKQRSWCPRCQGALLAPTADQPQPDPQWGRPPSAGAPFGQAAPPRPPAGRLPVGFRWIAVRPGAAPPQHRRRRTLSPTPRYAGNPGWGLVEHFTPAGPATAEEVHGPSEAAVRATLNATAIVLAVAAAAHILRYVLLLINRDMLLHPIIAGIGFWLGAAAGVAAVIAVIGAAVVLTGWLIARRRSLYAYLRIEDPRPVNALRAGCLIPVVNLLWAPVFLIETAMAEGLYTRLRKHLITWWVLWVASTIVTIFAIATSFTTDAQGIADNTVTTIFAYLVALATVVALFRVYDGFVRKPVDRPAHRWVVVDDTAAALHEPAA